MVSVRLQNIQGIEKGDTPYDVSIRRVFERRATVTEPRESPTLRAFAGGAEQDELFDRPLKAKIDPKKALK